MPADYRCQFCRLEFVVGWFHYHDFSSGFAAMTYLVCTRCGTQHALEHAATKRPDRWATFWQRILSIKTLLRVPDLAPSQPLDRLLAQSGPIIGKTETEDFPHPNFKEWIECQSSLLFRPVRQVPEYSELEAVSDHLSLSNVNCHHCNAVGSLTERWPHSLGESPHEISDCPSCGKAIEEPSSVWMT